MSEKDEWIDETKTADLKPRHVSSGGRKLARLVQLEGAGAPCQFRLEKENILLGRGEEADVRLESSQVSRRHLILRRIGPEFRCLDLESHNGVLLNGVRIHSAILKPGDLIQLGDVVLRFEEE